MVAKKEPKIKPAGVRKANVGRSATGLKTEAVRRVASLDVVEREMRDEKMLKVETEKAQSATRVTTPPLVPRNAFNVNPMSKLKPADFNKRVALVELPNYSTVDDKEAMPALTLKVRASPKDPFGHKDLAAIAKGPIQVQILNGKGAVIGTVEYEVIAAARYGLVLDATSPEPLLHSYHVTIRRPTK